MRLRGCASSCLLLLFAVGCGAAPRPQPTSEKLPRALAQHWAREAADIAAAAAAGEGCRAQYLARTLAEQVVAKNGRVPGPLRSPLLASVTALAGRIQCVHAVIQPPAKGPSPHGPKHPKPPKQPKSPKHGEPPHGKGGHGDGPGGHGDGPGGHGGDG